MTNNQLATTSNEMNQFLIGLCQKRLSGSSVLSVNEVAEIRASLLFVLGKSSTGRTVAEKFTSGKENILAQLHFVKEKYDLLVKQYDSFEITTIEQTIQSFQQYFSAYNIDFSAHRTDGIAIDYWLALPVDDQSILGIDFVEEYLLAFQQEQQFLQNLPKELILELLQVYQEKLKFDYRLDVNNIFQVVFNQFIVKRMLHPHSKLNSLLLTPVEVAFIFANRKTFFMEEKTFQNFIGCEPYYWKNLQHLQVILESAPNYQYLATFFLTTKESSQLLQLKLRPEMNQSSYLRMVNDFKRDENLDILLDVVASPYDVLNLLHDYILTGENLEIFIGQLALPLFSSLLLVVIQEENQAITSVADFQKINTEAILGELLQRRLKNSTTIELQEIDYILKQYRLTDADFS
ncbi:DUF6179 domain-containing protein [Enterococcus sp. HY326]|uniref:DUF6179 domain-containing protein n=1 Tax=Enterococcus sp. HY326 TaxID=2971265 RepID=UPI002240765A|nr:DUF6179 domain-containing protein [Enterococcus sp. HY326]